MWSCFTCEESCLKKCMNACDFSQWTEEVSVEDPGLHVLLVDTQLGGERAVNEAGVSFCGKLSGSYFIFTRIRKSDVTRAVHPRHRHSWHWYSNRPCPCLSGSDSADPKLSSWASQKPSWAWWLTFSKSETATQPHHDSTNLLKTGQNMNWNCPICCISFLSVFLCD